MLKTFPIDFVRQILEQKLLEQHMINVNLFGGKEQVSITSFYEQLKSQDEVDRFIETYRDLTEQQNRTGLILNGVLLSPENPTITNLYSSLIIPMEWTCSLRCTLENRDDAIITINNLINKLKGRKVDVAQLNCVDDNGRPYTTPFCVGTIGHGDELVIRNGNYLGQVSNISGVSTLIANLQSKGLDLEITNPTYFYVKHQNKLKVVEQKHTGNHNTYQFVEDDGTITRIVFPPEHTSFEQYKVSLSFDAIRCDEPRNLNEKEYCEISFGGSATLVNYSIQLGNDLLKIWISKLGYQAEQWVSFEQDSAVPGAFLEPLEMPSGSNANTQINQLISNRFISNSHTDALALSLQYTFIYDKSNPLLKQWFDYARYGIQPDGEIVPYRDGITPNIIYEIYEFWCSWGDFDVKQVKAKLVENIDVENTESDTLTLSLTMQIQGENTGGNNGGLQ